MVSPFTTRLGRREKGTTMLRKFIFTLVASSIALSATACHTVKGVGKDVQSVGEAADTDHR
jgi:predicted small secreted protein